MAYNTHGLMPGPGESLIKGMEAAIEAMMIVGVSALALLVIVFAILAWVCYRDARRLRRNSALHEETGRQPVLLADWNDGRDRRRSRPVTECGQSIRASSPWRNRPERRGFRGIR